MRWSLVLLATLCIQIAVLAGVEGGSCGDKPQLARTVNVAVMISQRLIDAWKRHHNNDPTLDAERTIRKELIPNLSSWYSKEKLGVSVKFNLAFTTIATRAIHNNIRRSSWRRPWDKEYAGVKAFCAYMKNAKERGTFGNKKWDFSIYFLEPKSEANQLMERGTSGLVANFGAICDEDWESNCLLIRGQPETRFLVLDRLAAHEIGHQMGINHPRQCRNGIMRSPGSDKFWSTCTKRAALKIFDNPWSLPCMGYQCGKPPAPTIMPGGISPQDREVLDKVCNYTLLTLHVGYKLADPEKTKNARKTSPLTFGKILRANPEWYLEKNVCKGVLCSWKEGSRSSLSGVQYMDDEPCGVNKVCRIKRDNQWRLLSAACVPK